MSVEEVTDPIINSVYISKCAKSVNTQQVSLRVVR